MRRALIFLAGVLAFLPVRGDLTVPLTQPVLLGRIGHGFNLGNALEAPSEGAWGVTLQESYFAAIHAAGFKSVRVPINWAGHVGPAPDFAIDPGFLARIDWVVQQTQAQHLNIILDYHTDEELAKDPDAYADRFVTIWKQIAGHFFAAPEAVMFELLNEAHGNLDAAHWNPLLTRALLAIRETNPQRIVIVGPPQWNSARALSTLELPAEDLRLAVTFHFYEPMKFTHQGASWVDGSTAWLGTKWGATAAEQKAVTDAFAQATAWAKVNNRPLYLGEFGAYEKGEMASRARWTCFVVQTANANHLPWSYWEFCAGFGAYDPQVAQWRIPLLRALQK